MNYRYATSAENPHLGGNLKEGDFNTHCPNVWSYLIDRFAVQSVLDLGSGLGYSSNFFHRKGCKTIAVDGLYDNAFDAVYPTVLHDLRNGPVITSVDLVHCQEVAEHIDEEFVGNLIGSLACGKFVLMTHALPGQLGHHHVNLQPPEYWISLLEKAGLFVLPEDTNRVRQIAHDEGAIYVAQTGLVLANRFLSA